MRREQRRHPTKSASAAGPLRSLAEVAHRRAGQARGQKAEIRGLKTPRRSGRGYLHPGAGPRQTTRT